MTIDLQTHTAVYLDADGAPLGAALVDDEGDPTENWRSEEIVEMALEADRVVVLPVIHSEIATEAACDAVLAEYLDARITRPQALRATDVVSMRLQLLRPELVAIVDGYREAIAKREPWGRR